MIEMWYRSIVMATVLLTTSALYAQSSEVDASFVLPHTRPAEAISVYDLSHDSAQGKMMAVVLQGVINQEQASVYVLARPTDQPQLQLLGKPYTIMPLMSGDDPGFMTMLRDHIKQVKKLIIWEESADYTWNLALMKASQEKGVAVTRAAAQRIRAELGFDGPQEDLRGRFTSRVAAYQWAIDHLLAGAGRKMVFSLGMRDDWRSAPWLAYDYAVASRSFTFWLDERIANERQMIAAIGAAAKYPTGTAVMGYGIAGDGLLNELNPLGLGFIVGDYYANGSVWASYALSRNGQERGKPQTAENGKIYVSLTFSDGDNAQFVQGALYQLWSGDAMRGTVPVASTFCPTLYEMAPPLVNYFYNNIGANDEIVAGPSGFEFIYLQKYPTERLNDWLDFNHLWIERLGIKTGHLWHADWYSQHYRDYIDKSGLDGIFDGEHEQGTWLRGNTLVQNQGDHLWHEGDLYNALIKLSPSPQAPEFKSLYLITGSYGFDEQGHPVGYTRIKREIDRLEAKIPGRIVYLLPKDLIATIKEYRHRFDGQTTVNIRADGRGGDGALMDFDNLSGIDQDHRFADRDAFWVYRINLKDDVSSALAELDIGGDYVISGSTDGDKFHVLTAAGGRMERAVIRLDLKELLTENPAHTFYLKFSDGTTNDGWGPSLWSLNIKTSP